MDAVLLAQAAAVWHHHVVNAVENGLIIVRNRRSTSSIFSALAVVSVSQAGRAELVVFLHDLLKFVSRAADHLVLIVVVLERATCGPVQDSLIKLTELRFWDIDVLGGPVRVVLYMPGAEDPLGEGFDVHRAVRAPGHVGWPER